MNKVKDQLVTEDYAIYNSDCMYVLPTLEDKSVDLSIYSPPFAGLYNYSSSENDFSNCESKEQFLEQYEYLVSEIARVTKDGRITAVHCTDVFDNTCRLWDFPNEIIRIHNKYGFEYRNRITIWKEPLKVRMRTMVQSLMHKFIVEDTTRCFTAMPDYVLIFTKKGENEVPVTVDEILIAVVCPLQSPNDEGVKLTSGVGDTKIQMEVSGPAQPSADAVTV